jgi:transcriptional regulator with XRE-family HTH domain
VPVSEEGVPVAKKATRAPLTLAEKIDHLFRAMPATKGEYSYEDVASAIRSGGGPTISATYVWQLRKGMRDNPTKKHLEALGSFFGVPPSYFFDEGVADRIDTELELLTAMRDPSVREVALRAAELSPAGREAVQAMIDQVRRLEGGSGPRRPRRGRAAAGDGADAR